MTQHIALCGAGVAGLCTALALAKQGFRVTVLERDQPPPDGSPDEAFFKWSRRGAAQFRHPHAFLGLMCSILERNHPDLLEDFFAAGARRVNFPDMVPPHLASQYTEQPGDEEMWVLMCRRATMETVLRNYVNRQPNIEILNNTYVTGVETEASDNGLVATGLHIAHKDESNRKSLFTADLYVDAGGRASKFNRWLNEQGADISEQRDDAEIVYYTRHFQLRDDEEEPNRHDHEPFAGDLGYLKYGVFPGDGGHFAIILCLPNHETELREAIKDGDRFDQICQQVPGLVPWLSRSTATTPPFGIGQIHAVWSDNVVGDKPQVLNFFAVADASARTNPLYGRGCSTGILHAQLLAEVLAEEQDPILRAQKFHAATWDRVRPIFDASLNEDKNGIKRAQAVLQDQDLNQASSLKEWFGLSFRDALGAAARNNIHVFRGMMRTVNLVEKPGDFLNDPKTKRLIFLYMLRGRRWNTRAQSLRGPTRREMLMFIDQLGQAV